MLRAVRWSLRLRSRLWLFVYFVYFVVCSHAEQVVISKIMYHPQGDRPEYIELYNNTATPLDIANWHVTHGVEYSFPDFSTNDPGRTFLKPFERILLSDASPSLLRNA